VSNASGKKRVLVGLLHGTAFRNGWRYLVEKPRRLVLVAVAVALAVMYGLPTIRYLGSRPLVVLWLVCAASLAGMWHRRQERRRQLVLLTVGFALLTLYCLPLSSYLLCGALEWQNPPLGRRPGDVEAIVVLAGGLRSPDVYGLPFQPSESTIYRCMRAAEMYRQGPGCPVIVSGGRTDPDFADPPCAQVMRDFLVRAGVAAGDLIEEDASRSTYENAVETARILHARGIRKVLLVTDGLHLPRAALCFRQQGVEVVPCGCSYRAREFEWSPRTVLPNPFAAQGVRDALHEYVGLATYSLQGRI
jgi:uncharacterized SAM-binding protein YcdF (DUF218 family)